MNLETSKRVVREWIQRGVNAGDLAAAEELFDPNVVAHAPQGDLRGIESGPKASVAMLRKAFPDIEVTIHDLIAEGDKVASRWTARANHEGEFMGVPPTGTAVTFDGLYVYRVTNGKISEVWALFDAVGLLRQMGKTI